MSSKEYEVYCCTCGVNKKGNSLGDNPTTMCGNCKEEKANFCCKCKIKLSEEQTLVFCSFCWPEVQKIVGTLSVI